jgi:hypothetical protein
MAREFTASNSEYLEVTSSPVSAWPITFGCWWKPANTTTQSEFFYIGDGSAEGEWIALGSRSDGADFRARYRINEASFNQYVWGGILSADTWYHIVGRITGDNDHDIFTDGSKVDGAFGETVPTLNAVAFGSLQDSSPSNYSDGQVAEAFIYDVALTDEEIAALAAGYSPLLVRPQSLQAYWPLIRDEDQDRVGGYDLTAFNTPTIAEHPPVIYPAQVYQGFAAAGAPPAGLSIPVAMHHYRQQGMSY